MPPSFFLLLVYACFAYSSSVRTFTVGLFDYSNWFNQFQCYTLFDITPFVMQTHLCCYYALRLFCVLKNEIFINAPSCSILFQIKWFDRVWLETLLSIILIQSIAFFHSELNFVLSLTFIHSFILFLWFRKRIYGHFRLIYAFFTFGGLSIDVCLMMHINLTFCRWFIFQIHVRERKHKAKKWYKIKPTRHLCGCWEMGDTF